MLGAAEFVLEVQTSRMTAAGSNGHDGSERLYQCLTELIDSGVRTWTPNELATRIDNPALVEEVQAYFEAVNEIQQIAARCTQSDVLPHSFPMPIRVGTYDLLSEIGRGGAAVVYQARQAGLNRCVAIKMLHGGRLGSLHDVERIRFEAEAVAQLQHPGIVPIHDVGEHEGRPWFCMPLFESGSLSSRMQDFIAQPRRAVEVVESIALAVQYAHERGILHRDLKPSNILLDSHGRPHVADFGLAKRLAENRDLTRTGELIGTPAYMAPERVTGSQWAGPTTIATDIYGLGVILYALLTGRPPFERDTAVETLLAVGTTEVIAPRVLNPVLDRELETICLKCLDKVPARRYATAAEVADDLRRWLNGEPIAARSLNTVARLGRWGRRHPVRATIALAAAAGILVVGISLSAGYLIVSQAYETSEFYRQTAEANNAQLNRQLYASQMSVAHRHLERGELVELRNVLNGFRNQPEQQGFEWRWLDRHAASMPHEISRLIGHTRILYGGAFSPDGRIIATCGADGTIRLWDAARGIEQQTFENGAGLSPAGVPFDENFVVFSPDGTRLASSGEDGGIRLWTIADGTRCTLSPTFAAEALNVSFSSDGRRLAAGWTDGHAQVWEVETGKALESPSRLVSPIAAVGFLPRGDDLVVAERNGNINIWSLDPLQVRRQITASEYLRCLAASPDGSLIAAAGRDGLVKLWDADDRVESHLLVANKEVRSLAFSPDGQRMAASGDDGCVRIWSASDHTLQSIFKAHPGSIWHVCFAPDGRRLLTVSSDLSARIWDVAPNAAPRDTVLKTSALRHVGFSPDGRRVAVVSADGDLSLCNPHDLRDQKILPVHCRTTSRPEFVDRSRALAFIDKDGAILCWDLEVGQRRASYPAPPHPATHIGLLGTSRLAAVTIAGEMLVLDRGRWQLLHQHSGLGHMAIIGSLKESQTLVMRLDAPPRTELWQIAGLQIVDRLPIGSHAESVADSLDGHWLALGRFDGTIELIDRSAPGPRRFLIGHHASVLSLAFSPDGQTLASSSHDGTARLWNVATGTELFVIGRSEGSLYSVAFSPDATALAVAGESHGEDRATLTLYRAE